MNFIFLHPVNTNYNSECTLDRSAVLLKFVINWTFCCSCTGIDIPHPSRSLARVGLGQISEKRPDSGFAAATIRYDPSMYVYVEAGCVDGYMYVKAQQQIPDWLEEMSTSTHGIGNFTGAGGRFEAKDSRRDNVCYFVYFIFLAVVFFCVFV